MTQPAIYQALAEIFRDVFDDPSITPAPAMTAEDVEGWDSLAHINLIIAIEQRFRIKFLTAELETLHNVGEMAALIERKLRAGAR